MDADESRIPRFHCPVELRAGRTIVLPDDLARHAVQVRRMRASDPIRIFDGEGTELLGRVERVGRGGFAVRLEREIGQVVESPLRVTLLQGLSSAERMDYAVQKAVELGVAEIRPVAMERSVARLDPERAARRREHWHRVAIASCEQCGRRRVPLVHPLAALATALDALDAAEPGTPRLLLSPREGRRPRELESAGAVALLVGPEGGLAPHEEALARRKGFVGLRLGPRVLRTETAGAAALAVLQALWGDI